MATYLPGTILIYDCGYTMSLPHFARVESVTASGKSVRVRELKCAFESLDAPYNTRGWKTPTDEPIGELMTCRINKYGSVKIGSNYAREWNGKPALYDCMD